MGTRSRIGILYGDGNGGLKVRSIYCHWDGYIEHNGVMLQKYYDNYNKLEELLALGDISSLRKNINPTNPGDHSFDNPEEDVVIAYHRDRGEDLHAAAEETFDEFVEELENSDIEFVYLRFRDEWLVATVDYCYARNKFILSAFKPLSYKVNQLKKEDVLNI